MHAFVFVCVLQILVKAGANINRQNDDGITPLIDAAAAMDLDMVEYLMDTGAKLHIQERDGWTAADHLEQNLKGSKEDGMDGSKRHRANLVLKRMADGLDKIKSSGLNVFLVKRKAMSTVFALEGDAEEQGTII